MRTRVAIDADAAQRRCEPRREHSVHMSELVNGSLRRGLKSSAEPESHRPCRFTLGIVAGIDIDTSFALADKLGHEHRAASPRGLSDGV